MNFAFDCCFLTFYLCWFGSWLLRFFLNFLFFFNSKLITFPSEECSPWVCVFVCVTFTFTQITDLHPSQALHLWVSVLCFFSISLAILSIHKNNNKMKIIVLSWHRRLSSMVIMMTTATTTTKNEKKTTKSNRNFRSCSSSDYTLLHKFGSDWNHFRRLILLSLRRSVQPTVWIGN